MTRRCSVMRIPVAAQRASMPVALSAGVDFSAVMGLAFSEACCATTGALRQVTAHQKRVQLFPARLPVIAFAAPGDGKSGAVVKPPRRMIIFLDLEEHGTYATAGKMAEMRQQQIAGQAAAAMAEGHRDRKYFGLVRRQARHREADNLPTDPQAVNQRVALGQHDLEFALTPAAMERCAVQLRQASRITRGRGFD